MRDPTVLTYRNPRLAVLIPNWPSGRHRVLAAFTVETHRRRGQRAVRVTHHPLTGQPSTPKKRTYAHQVRLVEGSDGRTYILELAYGNGMIVVIRGDMQLQQDVIWPKEERYAAIRALFEEGERASDE